MNAALTLRERSEAEASRLPPLLARAEQLAGTVLLGDHGRRHDPNRTRPCDEDVLAKDWKLKCRMDCIAEGIE